MSVSSEVIYNYRQTFLDFLILLDIYVVQAKVLDYANYKIKNISGIDSIQMNGIDQIQRIQ